MPTSLRARGRGSGAGSGNGRGGSSPSGGSPRGSLRRDRTKVDDSQQKTGKSKANKLTWLAIIVLFKTTVVLLLVGKRGIRHGIYVARRLVSGDDGGVASKSAAVTTTRDSGTGSVRGIQSKMDDALIDAAHNQRKEKVDAALHVASKTSSYQSASGEPVDDPTNLSDHLGSRLHVVFSTDCGSFQHWQSYLLFYSALRIGQPGRVTRIASGCKDDEEVEAKEWFDMHVRPMSSRFGLHLTPHFSTVKDENGEEKGDYKFFNKPFGLRHWLEHGDGMGLDENGKVVDEDVVVVLIDPDMLFLRPITSDFSDDRETVLGRIVKKDAKEGNRYMKVEKGKPFGQTYGFGNQWRKNVDVAAIVGKDSPALAATDNFARLHYPVGPPYMGVASDMHTIAVGWTDVVPKVHKQYPNLLAEMFGYCLSAAHNELPHQRIDSLMVSAVDMNGGEGWDLVDAIPEEEVCGFAMHPDHSKYAMPNVIHFCQRYGTGPYFFGKRKVPHEIFTCESPLMLPPPPDAAVKYSYRQVKGKKQELEPKRRKREAFVACAVIEALNEAASYFKRHHCGDNANFEAKLNAGEKEVTQAEIEEEEEGRETAEPAKERDEIAHFNSYSYELLHFYVEKTV